NNLTGSCDGGTITATSGSASVTLSGATLTGNTTCTFSINVRGASAGVENNSATVTSTQGTGNTASASITVLAPPVFVTSFAASQIPVGGTPTLTYAISNPNSTSSLTGIGFTDTLPVGLVVASPTGLNGSCGGGTIAAAAGNSTILLSGTTLG